MGINFAADHEADKAYRLIQEKASKRTSSSKRVNGGLQAEFSYSIPRYTRDV